MKKFQIIVKKFNRTLLYLSLSLITVIIFISARTKSKILSTTKVEGVVVDTVRVHFIHGSTRVKSDCIYEKERLGGYLGGHVEIEISQNVYGFSYASLPMNYLPHDTYNSQYQKRSIDQWRQITKYDKISSICIPIDIKQKEALLQIVESYHKNTPYDYAFLGQRCTSSAAEVLSDAGIINTFNNTDAIISFYYPRLFRKTMLKLAKKNNYIVVRKEGIDCYNWE